MDDITPEAPEPSEAGRGTAIRVRYWAGAADAAGVSSETLHVLASADGAALPDGSPEITVATVRASVLRAHPDLESVLSRCSVLQNARRRDDDDDVDAEADVEFLPPFAGG